MMLDRKNSLYIGNLGSIPLFLHWSAIFLLWSAYRWSNPAGGGDLSIVVIFAGVLIAGILLHELGHGLAAKALGALGITITLWALGGLCSSTRDRQPRREIIILFAGPAVSFLLAWGGWLALKILLASQTGLVIDDPQRAANVHAYIVAGNEAPLAYAYQYGTWLGQCLFLTMRLNLGLGIFNILPIYPLDGGQIVFNAMTMFLRLRIAAKATLFIAVLTACSILAWSMQGQAQPSTYLIGMLALLLYNAFTSLR